MNDLPERILASLFSAARFHPSLTCAGARWRICYLDALVLTGQDLRELLRAQFGGGERVEPALNGPSPWNTRACSHERRCVRLLLGKLAKIGSTTGRTLASFAENRDALRLLGLWCATIGRKGLLKTLLEDPRAARREAKPGRASLAERLLRSQHGYSCPEVTACLLSAMDSKLVRWDMPLCSIQGSSRCYVPELMEMARMRDRPLPAHRAQKLIAKGLVLPCHGNVRTELLLGVLEAAGPEFPVVEAVLYGHQSSLQTQPVDFLLAILDHPSRAKRPEDWIPILEALGKASHMQRAEEIVAKLISRPDVDPSIQQLPLRRACQSGNWRVARALLRDARCDPSFGGLHGANVFQCLYDYAAHSLCRTALSVTETLHAFLSCGRFDPTYGDPVGIGSGLKTFLESGKCPQEALTLLLSNTRVNAPRAIAFAVDDGVSPSTVAHIFRTIRRNRPDEAIDGPEFLRQFFAQAVDRSVQNDSLLAGMIEVMSEDAAKIAPQAWRPLLDRCVRAFHKKNMFLRAAVCCVPNAASAVSPEILAEPTGLEPRSSSAIAARAYRPSSPGEIHRLIRSCVLSRAVATLENLLARPDAADLLPHYEAIHDAVVRGSVQSAKILLDASERVGRPYDAAEVDRRLGNSKKVSAPNSWVRLYIAERLCPSSNSAQVGDAIEGCPALPPSKKRSSNLGTLRSTKKRKGVK